MNLQSDKNYVGPVSGLKEGKGQTLLVVTLCLMLAVLALFLKSVINFVRSNDIQCEICIHQSYEILSLLYYRDCFNL